jgi:hypothetical protein
MTVSTGYRRAGSVARALTRWLPFNAAAVANAREALADLTQRVQDWSEVLPAVRRLAPLLTAGRTSRPRAVRGLAGMRLPETLPPGGQPPDLSELGERECLELLAGREVGRLGFVAEGGLPQIVPVNYVFDGSGILVRTGSGGKLAAAELGGVVAFEVDDLDPVRRTGWSVLVVGSVRRLRAGEQIRAQGLPVLPWAPGGRPHFLRVTLGQVTGRRIGALPVDAGPVDALPVDAGPVDAAGPA